MKLKYDVEWHLDGIVRILLAGEKIYKMYGHELVITSLMDGEHKPNSLHYSGLAADFRTYFFDHSQLLAVVSDLRIELGDDYDVVLEPTHIHVEYDPK